jgi:selenocysteine-specific elongation factor
LLEGSPFAPPDPKGAGVPKEELRQLVRDGRVIERDGYYFSAGAMTEAARAVARLLDRYPDGVTASTVRDELRTTRKYVLPILGYLDATGVTRRRGDVRIGGPRLPTAPE